EEVAVLLLVAVEVLAADEQPVRHLMTRLLGDGESSLDGVVAHRRLLRIPEDDVGTGRGMESAVHWGEFQPLVRFLHIVHATPPARDLDAIAGDWTWWRRRSSSAAAALSVADRHEGQRENDDRLRHHVQSPAMASR